MQKLKFIVCSTVKHHYNFQLEIEDITKGGWTIISITAFIISGDTYGYFVLCAPIPYAVQTYII